MIIWEINRVMKREILTWIAHSYYLDMHFSSLHLSKGAHKMRNLVMKLHIHALFFCLHLFIHLSKGCSLKEESWNEIDEFILFFFLHFFAFFPLFLKRVFIKWGILKWNGMSFVFIHLSKGLSSCLSLLGSAKVCFTLLPHLSGIRGMLLLFSKRLS